MNIYPPYAYKFVMYKATKSTPLTKTSTLHGVLMKTSTLHITATKTPKNSISYALFVGT